MIEVDTKIRRFGVGDRIETQAEFIWMILICGVAAANGATVWRPTYGDISVRMGRERSYGFYLGRQLGMIGNYCRLHELPALNCLVVNETGVPGEAVMLSVNSTVHMEQRAVMEVDWLKIRVPSSRTFGLIWAAMKAEMKKKR